LSFGKIWQFGAVNGGYRLRAPYTLIFRLCYYSLFINYCV